jgi:hypothetical protein
MLSQPTRRSILIPAAVFATLLLAACSDRPRNVPASAQLSAEGTDRVAFTADRHGTVWVADQSNQKVLYSADLRPGDRVDVDADHNHVLLNDRVVLETGVHHAQHKIFFSPVLTAVTRTTTVVVPATPPPPAHSTVIAPAEPAPAGAAVVFRPAEIPATATLRARTTGDVVTLHPDADGTVWVVSDLDRRAIYSGRVLRGDDLTLDPTTSRLALNGRLVYTDPLPRGSYQVYFLPTAR